MPNVIDVRIISYTERQYRLQAITYGSSLRAQYEGIGLLIFALSAVAVVKSVDAGSAVAGDGRGRFFISYGFPKDIAEKRALALCYHEWGSRARIVASTDVVGFGAIAVAHKGNSFVHSIVLGRLTQEDANNRAIRNCLRAGGVNPRIRNAFKG